MHEKKMEEMKKMPEITNKALVENNVLIKRLLSLNNAPSTWKVSVAVLMCFSSDWSNQLLHLFLLHVSAL